LVGRTLYEYLKCQVPQFRDGRERPSLSVSVGISVYPEDGRTAPELLEAADRHLYKRKKAVRAQGVTAG
jgi:GGDEF domain-containing protein